MLCVLTVVVVRRPVARIGFRGGPTPKICPGPPLFRISGATVYFVQNFRISGGPSLMPPLATGLVSIERKGRKERNKVPMMAARE
jgi:hypothetical protein